MGRTEVEACQSSGKLDFGNSQSNEIISHPAGREFGTRLQTQLTRLEEQGPQAELRRLLANLKAELLGGNLERGTGAANSAADRMEGAREALERFERA